MAIIWSLSSFKPKTFTILISLKKKKKKDEKKSIIMFIFLCLQAIDRCPKPI